MGRPRRLKTNVETDGTDQNKGATDRDPANISDDKTKGRRMSTAKATGNLVGTHDGQSDEGVNLPLSVSLANHENFASGSSSSGPGQQNMGTAQYLAASPEDFDISQLKPQIDLMDFDHLADFDFTNDPGLALGSDPASPSIPQSSHSTRSRTDSIFEYPPSRGQHSAADPIAPLARMSWLPDPCPNEFASKDPNLINVSDGRSGAIAFDFDQLQASDSNGKSFYEQVNSQQPSELDTVVVGNGQASSCRCYETVLQKLTDLEKSHPDESPPSIDVALMLDLEIQKHIEEVFRCEACGNNRPALLLLVAIVVDHVVCKLEKTSNSTIKSPMGSRVRMTSSRDGAASVTDSVPLLVGNHEISLGEKNKFLKQLLQLRLSSLTSTLRQLMQNMERSPQSSSSKQGALMVMETYKRLQAIIGRVELWDG